MTNEELMLQFKAGNESVLAELCSQNKKLIYSRAKKIAEKYNCLLYRVNGKFSRYTNELLSDLKSVGMLALIECIRSGSYDPELGALTTYVVPRIDGAMRRYMEENLGTFSLNRDSMSLVRKAQRLYYEERLTDTEIGEALGISKLEAARYISYATHFFSYYDLASEDEEDDVLSYIIAAPTASPEQIVLRKIRMQYFEELFKTLSKKEQDILGKCFGVFGYTKTPLREIAMYHMMKEDAVEKAKNRILRKLHDQYPDSQMGAWDRIVRLMKKMRQQGGAIKQE